MPCALGQKIGLIKKMEEMVGVSFFPSHPLLVSGHWLMWSDGSGFWPGGQGWGVTITHWGCISHRDLSVTRLSFGPFCFLTAGPNALVTESVKKSHESPWDASKGSRWWIFWGLWGAAFTSTCIKKDKKKQQKKQNKTQILQCPHN